MGASIRVLVVEDDPSARLLLATALSAQPGLELCGMAADGLECLELVERLRPDAVLLDLIMPGMDGLAFLRALDRRRRPAGVVTSQAGSQEVVRHALQEGKNPVHEALLGGEDYCLLGSCAPDMLPVLHTAIPNFHSIGVVTDAPGIECNNENLSGLHGFDHFAAEAERACPTPLLPTSPPPSARRSCPAAARPGARAACWASTAMPVFSGTARTARASL